ncbi:uncharacterized protein LOC114329902 [Diabrotica virgifera virgifera]|uniref:Uncharacterized protein n=1 Tax=Diabrotica virgifera virgifera TaxID=50390 RepID=A0ABM5IKK5_DIAVI|nr:uncharacterized protein LOC114329902 [Diabrotica virgifera virgifera]
MACRKTKIHDPPPKEPTLEQHMIEFGKVTAASLNNSIGQNKKYLILQGNKTAQIFIQNAFEFFEKHFPNKNPHILTARCLQINVTAVRRFKKGPTEKTICQKPNPKKPKSEETSPKPKAAKTKKPVNSNKNDGKSAVKLENNTISSNKPPIVQQNINYHSMTINLPESYDSQKMNETRDIDLMKIDLPIFPPTSQNSVYPYSSGKTMDFQQQKPLVPDIFHLSPEPQYGAPSVAVATNMTHKIGLPDPIQSSTTSFQSIKQFNNQHSGYQFPHDNVPTKDDPKIKNHTGENLQNQYEQTKFNFGNIQSNQTGYKY